MFSDIVPWMIDNRERQIITRSAYQRLLRTNYNVASLGGPKYVLMYVHETVKENSKFQEKAFI